MLQPPLGHVENTYDFYLCFHNPNINQTWQDGDVGGDGVTTIRFCDKQLWLYLQFYKPFNKQTGQDCWLTCICIS